MAHTTCYPIDIGPLGFPACDFFLHLSFGLPCFVFKAHLFLLYHLPSLLLSLCPRCLYLLFRFYLLLPSCWPDAHTGITILLYLPFLKNWVKSALFLLALRGIIWKTLLHGFFFSFQSFFKPFRFLNVDKQCFYCMSIASLVSSFLFNNTSQEVHVDCTYLYNVAHRDLAFL